MSSPLRADSGTSRAAPVVAVIDGEIGAGKTTLIKALRAHLTGLGLQVAVVPEPVDEWERSGILQEFYEDKPPHLRKYVTYEFQIAVLASRVKKAREVVKQLPSADVYLLERSVLTDRFVFMELQRELVGEMRMNLYEEWWDMWAVLMPILPTHMVYLKPAIGTCMERVAKRAREGEVGADDGTTADKSDTDASGRGGVSTAYQKRLRMAHENFLEGLHSADFPGIPKRPFDLDKDVLVIGHELADDDFTRSGEGARRIAERVTEHLFR